MACLVCKCAYADYDAGTCNLCYEETREIEEALKRENQQLKAKLNFLRFESCLHNNDRPATPYFFTDVVLVAFNKDSGKPIADSLPIPAHKAVLASRSPVFKSMLEIEKNVIPCHTIKVSDVSYISLRAFVNYLYTAEAYLDEQMARDLLVLAEKYKVDHLKTYCEEFLIEKLNWKTSLTSYSFAYKHNAKKMIDAALPLILDNMKKLSKSDEYRELAQKDPSLLMRIYEASLSKPRSCLYNYRSSHLLNRLFQITLLAVFLVSLGTIITIITTYIIN